ncbi:MAG: aminoacyl-tRNA hydrolase [Alphaproteobacteria bacterium]|nr:aminoacyl-tRNA hydrolase [Alphaproteobacteria bacterium]
MDDTKPILIAGLGNPGAAYARNRHNVGFMAVDALAGRDADWKKEKNSLISKQSKIIFAKPQTFMNLSGGAVQSLMTFYKIPLENVIVIHDDMDIKLGDVRTKVGGGSAGHNGIKSIDAAIGPEYQRIRIGVGHPRDFDSPIPPRDWVLDNFSDEELKLVNDVIKKIPDMD